MPGKSKKSPGLISRPFATDLLKKARRIANEYQIILRFEDSEYYGRGLEMPMVMSDGKTPDECVAATREALVTAVVTLLEAGMVPPAPAAQSKRTEQINVRLTHEEKATLERAARDQGFRGIGDYVRATSLEHSLE